MSAWPTSDLAAIAAEDELRVAARRADGTLRDRRIVWHVIVDAALYIRSVRGEAGAWYRGVQAGVVDAGGVRAEVTFTPDPTMTTPSTAPTTTSTFTVRPCSPSPARKPGRRRFA